MRIPIGLAIVALGIVLIVLGINASDSFASDVHRFFTGNPTDRSVWFLIGGIAAIVVGLGVGFIPTKRLTS